MAGKFYYGGCHRMHFLDYPNCRAFGCFELGKHLLYQLPASNGWWKLFGVWAYTQTCSICLSCILFLGLCKWNPLPILEYYLYKCRSLTYKLQPMEAARISSVSGRMMQSMSWNAAMDMPPAPPYAYHGYAWGYAPAGKASGSTSGYHNSKLEVRHGRAQVAQSGISPQVHTRTKVVVLVQVSHLHYLLLVAYSRLKAIMSLAREYATSAFGWMT
jgi:hypothetical protein